MAEEAQSKKWEGKTAVDIPGATVDQIWPLLADFGNVHKWIPFFETCKIVEGVSGEPGAVRVLSSQVPMADGGKMESWVKEKLAAIDHGNKWYKYEVIDSSYGAGAYEGTMRVVPAAGEGGGCRVEWEFVSDPMPEGSVESLVASVTVSLQTMAKSMQESVA